MPHDFSLPQCTVYVWYLNHASVAVGGNWGPVGHSSIKISNGNMQNPKYEYLSWWPGHFPEKSGRGSQGVFSEAIMHVMNTNGYKDSSDKDEDHEGRKADYRCRITAGLNFDAMCDFARQVKTGATSVVPGQPANQGGASNDAYSFTKQNCSHAVAYCLNAGNPPIAPPLTGWVSNVWTPNHVYDYCRKLVTAITAAHGAGAAIQNTGGGWA